MGTDTKLLEPSRAHNSDLIETVGDVSGPFGQPEPWKVWRKNLVLVRQERHVVAILSRGAGKAHEQQWSAP